MQDLMLVLWMIIVLDPRLIRWLQALVRPRIARPPSHRRVEGQQVTPRINHLRRLRFRRLARPRYECYLQSRQGQHRQNQMLGEVRW
jgi:hypothetical protein